MSSRNKILLSIVLFHLLLVCAGAVRAPLWDLGTIGEWLLTYGRFSGSGNSYAFFAPNVGYGYRTQFDIYDAEQKLIATEDLDGASTREGNLRIANLVELISKNLDDPEKRQAISASLTGKLFARHANAVRIDMRVESMDTPSMQDYRDGVRYTWQPVYQAQYLHKKRINDASKDQ